MEFICPECEHAPFPTLKGWKRHMTAVHQGYTPDQLNDASGSNEEGKALVGGSDGTLESLESAIANLPATEGEQQQREIEVEQQRTQPTKEQRAAAKRIKARFDTLREQISGEIPAEIFNIGGMEPSEKQKKMLKDSIETTFEVFGIDFEVQPWNLTVRNPFLIMLYPLIVISWIVISAIMKQKQTETNGEKPDAT